MQESDTAQEDLALKEIDTQNWQEIIDKIVEAYDNYRTLNPDTSGKTPVDAMFKLFGNFKFSR